MSTTKFPSNGIFSHVILVTTHIKIIADTRLNYSNELSLVLKHQNLRNDIITDYKCSLHNKPSGLAVALNECKEIIKGGEECVQKGKIIILRSTLSYPKLNISYTIGKNKFYEEANLSNLVNFFKGFNRNVCITPKHIKKAQYVSKNMRKQRNTYFKCQCHPTIEGICNYCRISAYKEEYLESSQPMFFPSRLSYSKIKKQLLLPITNSKSNTPDKLDNCFNNCNNKTQNDYSTTTTFDHSNKSNFNNQTNCNNKIEKTNNQRFGEGDNNDFKNSTFSMS